MNIDLHRDIVWFCAGGREFTITGNPECDIHQAAGELRQKGYLLASTKWMPGAAYERVLPHRLTEKGN